MSSNQVYNLHRAVGHIYPLLTQWHGVKVKLHNISLDTFHQLRAEPKAKPVQGTKLSSALSFLCGDQSTTVAGEPANQDNIEPGTISFDKRNKVLRVKCTDGKYVLCSQVTVSGKKKMSAVDFNNGFLCKANENEKRFVNLDKRLISVENRIE